MDVLALLRSKNKCLERFLDLSTDFWEIAERGDLTGIEAFYQGRESILKALDLYDRKLSESIAAMNPVSKTPELRRAAQEALDQWNQLVRSIVTVDSKIIRVVEKTKEELAKEQNGHRKAQEMVNKFKSTWIQESGDSIDKKL